MRRAALLLLAMLLAPVRAHSEIVTSTKIEDVAVTIYQDPRRDGGAMIAGWPRGYALITETRTISIPAGESQIRFENVAEGLMPETAIVTGLPTGVREKNRDARLISPAGLVDAYLKRTVRIRRTDPATGKAREEEAIIQAGPSGGVILTTAAGVEAFKCSGLPERMTFGGVPEDLTARPTLSILTRSRSAITARIQLTYMAQGFDWSANYIGNMADDGQTMGLFAWLTVANGGAQTFPNARLQVIGGKPNKGDSDPPPSPPRSTLDLQCWPIDTTHTHPTKVHEPLPLPPGPDLSRFNEVGRNAAGTWQPRKKKRKQTARRAKGVRGNDTITVTGQRRSEALMDVPVSVSVMSAESVGYAPPPPPPPPEPITVADGAEAQQEELGDLKLYRVPMRVTVAALSQKQVAMLSQPKVTMTRLYTLDLRYSGSATRPLALALRGQNIKEAGLGLPLPAGSLALFETAANRRMLAGEHDLDDLAIGQDVDLDIGMSPDVQGRVVRVSDTDQSQGWRLELSNARPFAILAEILVAGELVDPPNGAERTNGGWKIRLNVPANDRLDYVYRLVDDR